MSQPNGHSVVDYDERSPLLPCRIQVEPNSTLSFVQQTSNGDVTLGKRIRQTSSRCSVSSSQITLSWENINVSIRATSTRCCCRKSQSQDAIDKQILFKVSGVATPGTLLAILGSSGGGKTTLLNVLNQRNVRALKVQGQVKINGTLLGKEVASISGYVQQDDLFLGTLTVREHLWFQAMLRIGKHLPKADKLQRIEEVIQELGLTKCSNSRIGVPGKTRGISGGERKRLAFASEVLTNPPLLFCDEPTSGLDSFHAENVVRTLKGLAAKGKTVVCTIHQPSSQVYALFDRVLFLAEGCVAYFGSTENLPTFFDRLGNTCPPNFNPADYYIHALAVIPGREDECRSKVLAVCDSYEDSAQFDEVQSTIQQAANLNTDSEIEFAKRRKNMSPYKASILQQFYAVLWRSWVTYVREPALVRSKVFQYLVSGILFGLIYLNQSYDQKGIMNINGALFLLQNQMSFGSVFPVVNTFPPEFPIFMREHHDGMYRTGIYYICKVLAEINKKLADVFQLPSRRVLIIIITVYLQTSIPSMVGYKIPIFLFVPIMFSSISYWMIGLYDDFVTFLIATAVLVLVANVAVSFGYLISSMSTNVNLLLAIAPICLVTLMLFGGLFVNSGSIPIYFLWLKYISWFNYSNEILVVNQWRNVKNISCDVSPPAKNMLTHLLTTLPSSHELQVDPAPSTRCFTDGKAVIESLSFHEDNVFFDFMILLVLLVGFRIISFLLIYLRSRKRD